MPPTQKPAFVTALPPLRLLWPAAVLSALLLFCQALPESVQLLLRYDRALIGQGEYWRMLSANFVHVGWAHFWLNVAGLWFVALLYGGDRSAMRWLAGLLASCLATSLWVYLLRPEIAWMAGLSGALHGLFVLGAVGVILAGEWLGWGLLGGVLTKLAWEQTVGALPMTGELIGGSVVTAAHLGGAAGGLLAALPEIAIWRRPRARL